MEYKEVILEISDKIATITLNRPDKLNAWTFLMETEYRHAMATAEESDEVRVIIVTGAGRGFCAGADMGLLSSITSGTLDLDSVNTGSSAPGEHADTREDFKKQYSFPAGVQKPIIAAINGHAMGIGLVHALYCDIRFASESAKFGTAFAHRGLIAEHGISWLLPRLVGLENALDLLFSARVIDAQEAHRMGMVSRIVPADELLPRAREYAAAIAAKSSPRSLRVMKKQVWDDMHHDLGPAIEIAVREMMESFTADDFTEGVLSFMEKRPPNFTGK
jgi:enoyl-CoA hydratase/carnithine racemase